MQESELIKEYQIHELDLKNQLEDRDKKVTIYNDYEYICNVLNCNSFKWKILTVSRYKSSYQIELYVYIFSLSLYLYFLYLVCGTQEKS